MMDRNTFRAFMTAASDLPAIGDFYEGGYFAGLISHTANGVPTHGLIVAPAASGYNGKVTLQWKTTFTATSGTDSLYDGAINTANMDNADHPAAQYCAGLTINGYSDWYLPAIAELDIAYFYLKPTTALNNTIAGNGENPYAVPQRTQWASTTNPPQTPVVIFQSGETEAFATNNFHLASTEFSAELARSYDFDDGQYTNSNKLDGVLVRAFRKFAL